MYYKKYVCFNGIYWSANIILYIYVQTGPTLLLQVSNYNSVSPCTWESNIETVTSIGKFSKHCFTKRKRHYWGVDSHNGRHTVCSNYKQCPLTRPNTPNVLFSISHSFHITIQHFRIYEWYGLSAYLGVIVVVTANSQWGFWVPELLNLSRTPWLSSGIWRPSNMRAVPCEFWRSSNSKIWSSKFIFWLWNQF